MHCPMCWSRLIRRSKRRGLLEVTLMQILFVRPYRCVECEWRFFRWSIFHKAPRPRAHRHDHAH
jgi:hypothetical protein